MKKFYQTAILFFSLIASQVSTTAQVNEVLRASQFGGVSNVNFNPAIADNRFKFDMNLFSAGFSFENNYIGVKSSVLTHPSTFNEADFQSKYMSERLNGNDKKVFSGISAQGPLSFMIAWGKDHKNNNALAVTWHSNFIFNIDGVGESFARIAYFGFGNKAQQALSYVGKDFRNQNLSMKTLAWTDYGATYSRVVYDKGNHMIKAGVTGKVILGLAGGFISSKNIQYKFNSVDSISIVNSDVSYGHSNVISENFDLTRGTVNVQYNDLRNNLSKPSFAVDLGIIYEWRPDKDKLQYEMDCNKYYKTYKNNYKLSVGFSVIDIGRLKFSKPVSVRDYKANVNSWDVAKEPIKDIQSFDSIIYGYSKQNKYFSVNDSINQFTVWLPTRFNIFIDYEIWKGIGVNLNTIISPVLASVDNQVHYPTSVTLTPRYDWKWVGAYLPLSYNEYGNFGLGVGLRAGPLFVTSSNLITSLAGSTTYGVNIQAGLKITIPNTKHKDKDHDGVSNRKDKCKLEQGTCATEGCPDIDGDGVIDEKDKCPTKAGPKENDGCPDRDKDGVYDQNDSCPDVAGAKEYAGCPDTDGDGIIDKNDSCPTQNGLLSLHGCPDKDGDGVADKDDDCPDVIGLPSLRGCPDRDNDGVADKDDACPDVPGEASHKGCPDSDGDGIYDNEDKCPRIKGTVENKGCPAASNDTDGDGILDKNDDCPTVYGVKENRGCPALEKKELETLKYAFENLEFETGKDKIKDKSFPSLTGLAKLLIDKGYGLKIAGHTDNVGKPEMNLDLSRRRAEAVKAFMIDKGIAGTNLSTEGYGASKPIADNKTPAGRQKNRRVEMSILYK